MAQLAYISPNGISSEIIGIRGDKGCISQERPSILERSHGDGMH
jgi:hypothetical protein